VIDSIFHWVPWCIAACAGAPILWPVLRWPRGWRAAALLLQPRGRAAVVTGIAATIVFNIAVSLLFCATAAQMFDLYSGQAPAWMHAR
jgi:hypothetical protein